MFKLKIVLKNKCDFIRFFSSKPRFSSLKEAARFLCPLLDASESSMYTYLSQHSFLVNLEPADIRRKITYFKYLNATNSEILEQPMLFTMHLITIENRSNILRECGFVESLSLMAISKYVTLIKQRIKALKINKFIPFDLNMVDQLKKQFDINIDPKINYSDEMHLQTIREHFLNAFLRERLNLTDDDFKKLWKTYFKVKHKSFGNTQRVVDILQYDLKLTREKIIGNLFLLHSDPENLLRYPEVVPSIAGMSMLEVMRKQPKIMMVPCENVKELLGHLRENGIDEAGVLKYSTILTLSPDTVLARLEQMKKTKEFEVLSKHPRITKLITYQTKAAIRLDFLQQLKVRCASLNVLSSHSESFEKYVRDGYDRTKGKDITHYLNKVFQDRGTDAIKQLRRHANWFHVPAVQMQETLDYLKGKQFSLEEIYENVQIILYSTSRISRKLDYLLECKKTKKKHVDFGMELNGVTPAQMLSLCLYMIELDFHFTGDGIWPDQVQQSDSSTTTIIELPKSLNKEYRYGIKPPMSRALDP